MAGPDAHTSDRRLIRAVLIACTVLLCALVGAFAWIGSRVLIAAAELRTVEASAHGLSAAVAAGDTGAAANLVRELTAHLDAAAGAAADPTWPVAETLPWLGDDLAAVRVLATHGAALADAATPIVAALAEGIAIDGGARSTTELATLRDQLGAAAARAHEGLAAVAGLSTGGLLPPLREATDTLHGMLAELAPAADTLTALAAVAPVVLGLDEPRSVLLTLQNIAEPRTGGGITGSFALLDADDGRLTLRAQADSGVFPVADAAMAPVPAALTTLYGDIVGRFVQNASMSSDFALTARLASAWWVNAGGDAPDVVVSIDPLVVRSLLGVTGPLALPDGTELTTDNLVQRLLVDPYLTFDADGQTAFLQSVTTTLVDRLTTVEADPLTWARALADPLAQGRISVWTADAGVQAAIDDSALAGPAARHRAAGPDAFAVYFNDATGGKMGSYLQVAIESEVSSCRLDGRAEVAIRLTMSSSVPAGAVLPPDLTGDGKFGTAINDIGTSVSVAAPPGSFFSSATKDGIPQRVANVVDSGFPTSLVRVNLSPGEVNVVEFRFVAAEPGEVTPVVLTTPLINRPEISSPRLVPCV